ncbi:MAG: hypothetical protein PUC33_07070 [Oscillospiraceae bacterium]|nr:hypothetical protein [Oscillospiraceae bacterium]MDD6146415.1 hypothetical protein [Oscillospiraceae bacterium]
MKKIIAILLSLIFMFSSLGLVGCAFDDIIPEDEPIGYGIIYKMDTFSTVKITYKPKPSISFKNPGTYTITSDTPLSVDYQFVCWKHSETGKLYYAGDKIYVDGQIVLVAVWEEKTDNHIRPTRVLLTALETLRRTLGAFFGFYQVIEDFEEEYFSTTEAPEYVTFTLTGDNVVPVQKSMAEFKSNPTQYQIDLKGVADTYNGNAELIHFTLTGPDAPQGGNYSAEIKITDEINADGNQFIIFTFTDGVPAPKTGQMITFTIPKGFLVTADGRVNEAYTCEMFTTLEL